MTILGIINQYESLKKGLKFIMETSSSNHAPYHNLNHMLVVTKHCYMAADHLNLLAEDNIEELLMAALFHDYNHSQGKQTDRVNVSMAKFSLRKFVLEKELNLDIDFMEKIIDATEYPYVIPKENLNIYQSIIRDADLCQMFEYNWLQQNLLGLSAEMEIPQNELVGGMQKFIKSIEFLTEYGASMRNKHMPILLKDLRILNNLLK